jgi:hypothetical protein
LRRGLNDCGENRKVQKRLPQALKRGYIFDELTARVNSCPSRSSRPTSEEVAEKVVLAPDCRLSGYKAAICFVGLSAGVGSACEQQVPRAPSARFGMTSAKEGLDPQR